MIQSRGDYAVYQHYSDGSKLGAARYLKGADGCIVAEFADETFTTEVPNTFLNEKGLIQSQAFVDPKITEKRIKADPKAMKAMKSTKAKPMKVTKTAAAPGE